MESIIQFVCFSSLLGPEEFPGLWASFAAQITKESDDILLEEEGAHLKNKKFSYVSRHHCRADNFNFAFLNGKKRGQFPEQKATVKQAGGYIPLQLQYNQHKSAKGESRIIAFISHGESELDFYRLQQFHYLNIYEAYFENCTYEYVMEFFLQQKEAPALLSLLKARTGVEAALYREC